MIMLKIAWRNLLRNKRRSAIALTSIIVGVATLLFLDSLMNGFVHQMLNNQIESTVGHIQIHDIGYNDNRSIKKLINPDRKTINNIRQDERVEETAKRLIVYGMVSSAANFAGAQIYGIQPEYEKNLTYVDDRMIEGKYPEKGKKQVIIGKKMAEKLEVGLGDKIVVQGADPEGIIKYELFRISGIYKTSVAEFDNTHAFVPLEVLQKAFGLGSRFTEIVIKMKDIKDSEEFANHLGTTFDSDHFEVRTYREIIPIIVAYVDSYKQMAIIFYIIVGIAVIFGIVNTMLMSVFERIREFGVLMSIGMKSRKIFMMVLQEALLLGITGTIFGFVVWLGIHLPLSVSGMDLSIFSEGLESFGIDAVIFPKISSDLIINASITMPITTIIGAIYPAMKAISLQPTEAMRYV